MFPEPNCLARPYENAQNFALQSNGFAKPAVAKDVIPGVAIHKPEFANDGFYGNGSSWISASSNSWLKIDLGQEVLVDSIRFGRDRTGNFDDRDPGSITIEVALEDNAYANEDSTNDASEYTQQVFSASLVDIDSDETLKASFDPVLARYIKVSFGNVGTAIDEIEVAGNLPATQQLENLASTVVDMNLQAGISNALDAKLSNALAALDDANEKNDGATLNMLYAFCSSVDAQRGGKLDDDQANTLIDAVNAVIAALDQNAPSCQ